MRGNCSRGAPPLSNSKSMKACRVAQDEIRQGFVTFVLPERLVEPTVDHPLLERSVSASALPWKTAPPCKLEAWRMDKQQQPIEPVRAYLEYFRDMGVYDFYRNGEPQEFEAVPLRLRRAATVDRS